MKNSIEEDIKILEEMIENANIENMDMNDCFGGEHIEAIEHILSDYKRVLQENEYMHNELNKQQTKINKYAKENEELKSNNEKYIIHLTDEQYKTVIENAQNDINQKLIQKVKDKIEELKQEKKKYGNCLIEMYEDELVNRDIKILQELLEGRK